MTLVVQTDDGDVVGANGYITVEYFTTHHTDRAVAQVVDGDFSNDDIEASIVAATDYIDQRWRFKGKRLLGQGQTTEFPRSCLYDREGLQLEGLPVRLLQATAEYALRAARATAAGSTLSPDPVTDDSGQVVIKKAEAVGPISTSVEYAAGGTLDRLIKPYPAADRLMRDFIAYTKGVIR